MVDGERELSKLIADVRPLTQLVVMRRAARVPLLERAAGEPMLRALLHKDGPEEQQVIRAAQIVVAWLPSSLSLVLEALNLPSREVRFALLCSITDLRKTKLKKTQNELVPAILRSVATSGNSDVEYMGVEALLCFEAGTVRPLMRAWDQRSIIWRLGIAASSGQHERVSEMISYGFDVNTRADSGRTVLHLATDKPEAAAVLVALLRAGAEVNAMDDDGETALMWACHRMNSPAVCVLVTAGADAFLKDADGKTAQDHLEASYREAIKGNRKSREKESRYSTIRRLLEL